MQRRWLKPRRCLRSFGSTGLTCALPPQLGGKGGLEPKSPNVCVPKIAQVNLSFCKFHFFPTMKSGSKGGAGVRTPPPPGHGELLSKTLVPGLVAVTSGFNGARVCVWVGGWVGGCGPPRGLTLHPFELSTVE